MLGRRDLHERTTEIGTRILSIVGGFLVLSLEGYGQSRTAGSKGRVDTGGFRVKCHNTPMQPVLLVIYIVWMLRHRGRESSTEERTENRFFLACYASHGKWSIASYPAYIYDSRPSKNCFIRDSRPCATYRRKAFVRLCPLLNVFTVTVSRAGQATCRASGEKTNITDTIALFFSCATINKAEKGIRAHT